MAPYSPTEFVAPPFSPPAIPKMWLGSDYIGHDVLTRVLYGGRTVILLALAATVIGLVLGVTLGLVTGYARRWIDESIMRILDVVLAFPQIVLALLFVSILGPRLWLIVVIVGISHAPRIARVARAATLEVSQRDFVRAAEAFGHRALEDPLQRDPAEHHEPAAGGVRPAAHLLDRRHRRPVVPRFRHAAAGGRLGPHDQREPHRHHHPAVAGRWCRWRSSAS